MKEHDSNTVYLASLVLHWLVLIQPSFSAPLFPAWHLCSPCLCLRMGRLSMCSPWPSAFLVHGLWNVPPHSRLYRPSGTKPPKAHPHARHTGSPSFQGHPNCLKHPASNSELIFDSVSSFISTLGKNLASISPSKALQILPLSLYSSLHLGPSRNLGNFACLSNEFSDFSFIPLE